MLTTLLNAFRGKQPLFQVDIVSSFVTSLLSSPLRFIKNALNLSVHALKLRKK